MRIYELYFSLSVLKNEVFWDMRSCKVPLKPHICIWGFRLYSTVCTVCHTQQSEMKMLKISISFNPISLWSCQSCRIKYTLRGSSKVSKWGRFVFPFFFAFLFYKETINAHNSIKSIYFSIIIPTTQYVILFIATHDNKASLGFEPDTRHLNMSKMICHFNHLEFLGFQPVDHSSLK